MNISEAYTFYTSDLASLATEVIEKNKDVFIAQYILQNLDVKISDIVMCYQPNVDGGIEFYIKEKV